MWIEENTKIQVFSDLHEVYVHSVLYELGGVFFFKIRFWSSGL
jgi:hypothetical protein